MYRCITILETFLCMNIAKPQLSINKKNEKNTFHKVYKRYQKYYYNFSVQFIFITD